jgi:hypothetical protein
VADNHTDQKNKSKRSTGIGRIFKTIGTIFNQNREEPDSLSSIPVDISPDIGEIPPVIHEHEENLSGDADEGSGETFEGTLFGDKLNKILSLLQATGAQQIFVEFLRQKEADRLTPSEQNILRSAYNRSTSLEEEKKKKYENVTGNRNLPDIAHLVTTLEEDTSTPPFVKQEIVKEIVKELQENPPADKQGIPSLINQCSIFIKRLDWEMKGENRIINYTVKTLNKIDDPEKRLARLHELGPFMEARIKDKKLKGISRELFVYMLDLYTWLNERVVLPEETPETTPAGAVDSGADLDDGVGFDFDDDHLPDFGADEDAFLKKLAEKDDPSGMASEIDKYPEEQKADIIEEIAFDPRFDRYFNEIVMFLNKEDLGKLIGIIIGRVKELERTQGRHISRAYVSDLINRLAHKFGPGHIIVLKVKNIQHHLQKAYSESAEKLEDLKRKLSGKSPYDQIQLLKDFSEDPAYASLFGAIRNLERLTVETYFDEIFSGLPLETQKVVAEGLLSDLVALKQYYPYLIQRLETKLDEVTLRLKNTTYTPGEVDNDLINRIVDYADKTGSFERSGDGQLGRNEAGRVPEEIKALDREIDSLSTLNEKITTVRFWIENKYYSEKPQVEQFLKNKLESLEQTKAREGGLLRDLFDELRGFDTIKEKINFLEEKLKDPLYYHLRSMIRTLIGNIAENTDFAPEEITEEWILTQLKGIPDINRKIDWLRIRRYLAPYQEFTDFINETIERFETHQKEELQEELEDKIFGDISPEQESGKGKKIYKNIITLTRAALSLPEKVERRKLIKQQETLYPLDDEDRFYRQRKLLYYLLNTQTDEVPSLKLKVLADKVLLSFEEKRDFFSLLKLSRYKAGDKVLTLMDELGMKDEDLAYYTVYILGCNRPGLEKRIQFIEDFRNGLVDVDGVVVPAKNNTLIQKDYREFFHITPPVIVKVLKDLKKKLPEKRKKLRQDTNLISDDQTPGEETAADITGTGEEVHVDNEDENKRTGPGITETDEGIEKEEEQEILPSASMEEEREPGITETDGMETESIKTEDRTGIDDQEEEEEKKTGEDTDKSPEDMTGTDGQEDDVITRDKQNRKGPRRTRRRETLPGDTYPGKQISQDDEDEQITPREEDVLRTSLPGDTENEEKEYEKKDQDQKQKQGQADDLSIETVYEENKTDIDMAVQKRIKERGAVKSKDSAHVMHLNSEKVVEEKEVPLPTRIAGLLTDLSRCFPEAVPDIINRTIIPVFVENKSEAGRDIFNALNQNIFIPVLYNGAEVDIDTTVNSIESFLGKKGILSESRNIIKHIVQAFGNVRSKEIKTEVDRKVHGGSSLSSQPVKKDPGDITGVLRSLLSIEDPNQIIPSLDEQYILPVSGDDRRKDVLKKLHTLKSILQTSKSINWGKVSEYYGETAISLIKQIKQRIGIFLSGDRETGQNIVDRGETLREDETGHKESEESSSGKKAVIPKIIENALMKIPFFTDPHAVISKISSGNQQLKKMFGGNNNAARQYVIDTLYNAGKIFTYDKKNYIGSGRIAPYLYDKSNKGYNKPALAQSLLAFLARFPQNALKASFLGIGEEKLEDFLGMLDAWVHPGHPPADRKITSGTKKTLHGEEDKRNLTPSHSRTHEEKTKHGPSRKSHGTTKMTQHSTHTPRLKERRTFTRRKKKTRFSPEKEKRKSTRRSTDRTKTKKKQSGQNKRTLPRLSARGEAMLKKAEKLITDKLIYLIKMYNNREPLKMLYNSYLSPHSDKKYRLNLIDQRKHSAIYNAIKDDDAVLERLRFNAHKVMKQYNKQLKKIKS